MSMKDRRRDTAVLPSVMEADEEHQSSAMDSHEVQSRRFESVTGGQS